MRSPECCECGAPPVIVVRRDNADERFTVVCPREGCKIAAVHDKSKEGAVKKWNDAWKESRKRTSQGEDLHGYVRLHDDDMFRAAL